MGKNLVIGLSLLFSLLQGCKERVDIRSGLSRSPATKSEDPVNQPPITEAEPHKDEVTPSVVVESPAVVPRIPVTAELVIARMVRDLAKIEPSKRKTTRYFVMNHIYNSGVSDEQLLVTRMALAKHLNSLSSAPELALPVAIDEEQTVFRIALEDFGWDEATWKLISDRDPYGVIWGFEGETELAELSGTKLSYTRADWFMFAASQPFLYHQILKIPATLQELAAKLEIDIVANIKANRVVRAGVVTSGVSQHNRMVERHQTKDGYFWLSYDFTSVGNTMEHNLFAFPLSPNEADKGFAHAGGEVIFSLPNGLQAYMLVDEAGKRLDRAPVTIVSDIKRPDRQVTNGISCMACHVRGLNGMSDMVRTAVDANTEAYTLAELSVIRKLYPGTEAMSKVMGEDIRIFTNTMEKLGYSANLTEPILAAVQPFEAEVTPQVAASEMGLTVDEMRRALQRANSLSRILGVLQLDNGRVKREVFQNFYIRTMDLLELADPANP